MVARDQPQQDPFGKLFVALSHTLLQSHPFDPFPPRPPNPAKLM